MNRAHNHSPFLPSDEQRKKYFALCNELGLDTELRRAVNHRLTGKSSWTEMTKQDAVKLIDRLKTMLEEKRRGASATPNAGRGAPARTGGHKGVQAGVAVLTSVVSPTQQVVILHLYQFLGFDRFAGIVLNQRILKKPWPQSTWEGQAIIYALLDMAAPKMLEAITAVGFESKLSAFEHEFMLANSVMHGASWNSALFELRLYVGKKNERGRRTMPRCSLTKFFEILEKHR